jgi:hypothetical protein
VSDPAVFIAAGIVMSQSPERDSLILNIYKTNMFNPMQFQSPEGDSSHCHLVLGRDYPAKVKIEEVPDQFQSPDGDSSLFYTVDMTIRI